MAKKASKKSLAERFTVVSSFTTTNGVHVWGCRDSVTNTVAPSQTKDGAERIREACVNGRRDDFIWEREVTGVPDSPLYSAPYAYSTVGTCKPVVEFHHFETGAVRSTDANGTRFDLISPVALQALAETYAEGAAKYGDNNWLQGIPTSDLLNHALRHLNMWQQGDTSEPHLAHAAWNILAMIHFEKTRPELVVRPYANKPCQETAK